MQLHKYFLSENIHFKPHSIVSRVNTTQYCNHFVPFYNTRKKRKAAVFSQFFIVEIIQFHELADPIHSLHDGIDSLLLHSVSKIARIFALLTDVYMGNYEASIPVMVNFPKRADAFCFVLIWIFLHLLTIENRDPFNDCTYKPVGKVLYLRIASMDYRIYSQFIKKAAIIKVKTQLLRKVQNNFLCNKKIGIMTCNITYISRIVLRRI